MQTDNTSAPNFMQMMAAAMMSEQEKARIADLALLDQKQRHEDAAREAAPKITLVAITGWTEFDGTPGGRVIVAGQDVTISEYDRQKYAGRAVPRA